MLWINFNGGEVCVAVLASGCLLLRWIVSSSISLWKKDDESVQRLGRYTLAGNWVYWGSGVQPKKHDQLRFYDKGMIYWPWLGVCSTFTLGFTIFKSIWFIFTA